MDVSPPEIIGAVISSGNDSVTVTFDTLTYNTSTGTGDLEASDFTASITGGTANTPVIGGVTFDSVNVYLDITFTNLADGTEVLAITPVTNSIHDFAGNAASTTQTDNTVIMNDQTPPATADPIEVRNNAGQAGNVVETNGDDVIYVKDLTPTILDVTFTDAMSTGADEIILACTVDGNTQVIDNVTGLAVTTLTNNISRDVTFAIPLTEGNYFGSAIFTVADEPIPANTRDVPLANFTVDMTAPSITGTDSLIDISGSPPFPNYIDVTFANEMLFNGEYGTEAARGAIEVTDFTVTLQGGLGQAQLASTTPSSIRGQTGAITAGESIIRLQLDLDSDYTPDGTEIVTVTPVNGEFFDAAGNLVSTTQNNNTTTLVDQYAPVLYIDPDPLGPGSTQIFNNIPTESPVEFSGNVVDGVVYIRDNTPSFTLFVTDAVSTGSEEITLQCFVDNVEKTLSQSVLTHDPAFEDAYSETVTIDDILLDGAYNGIVVFEVTDLLNPINSRFVTADSFTVDSRPPILLATAIADDNSTITVTFDTEFYGNENAEDGFLGFDDFTLTTITSGVATVVLSGPAVKTGLNITIPLTITGIPDGTEQIEIDPVANSIFDVAGNPASSSQINNIIALNDETPPILIDALGNPDQIFTDIPVNFVNGEYFFDDINPTVTLKATDASSDTVIITCEVGGVVKNITPSYRPFDDSDKRAYIITGDEIEVNITDDLAAGEYNAFNRIEFIPMDISGNIGRSARTFQVEDAAILDPGYATFSGATVADSNFYIDVYFNEGVYGDENAQTGLSDNALIIGIIVPFNGTATAISIDSLKNYTGAELIGGEDTIRVFLNVTGTPNGLENIEIFATSNSTVFDQSGTFTPATYSMSQAVGGRYLRDLTSPALELIDISGNTVAGMKYVAVNTPTLTITAEDAKSIEVDALSLTCTVNGNPVIINPIVITSEVATVIEFVTELVDTVFTFGDIIFMVTDTAGNSNTLSPATFTVDTGDPTNPEIGSLSTIVNSVAGWWNEDNVAIDITVILPTESTLLGGSIQLKAKVG